MDGGGSDSGSGCSALGGRSIEARRHLARHQAKLPLQQSSQLHRLGLSATPAGVTARAVLRQAMRVYPCRCRDCCVNADRSQTQSYRASLSAAEGELHLSRQSQKLRMRQRPASGTAAPAAHAQEVAMTAAAAWESHQRAFGSTSTLPQQLNGRASLAAPPARTAAVA